MDAFLEPFLVLFALIGLGVLVGRVGILRGEGASQLAGLVMHVTLPATIFLAVAEDLTPEAIASAPQVVALGLLVAAATWGLAWPAGRWLRLADAQRGVFAFGAGCTNTGFLGIPLVGAVLGPSAVVTAVLYDFSTTVMVFTLGLVGLTPARRQNADAGPLGAAPSLRGLLRNALQPMFLALVLGVGWGLLRLPLPAAAREVLAIAGGATTPLAMIALGHMLYDGWGRATQGRGTARPLAWAVGTLAGLRLLLAPALMLGAVRLLAMPAEAEAVCLLQAGMPAAMLTAIFAQQYGVDHRFGLAAALGTTALSLATLPLLALVTRALL